jgi:hypothetical protein
MKSRSKNPELIEADGLERLRGLRRKMTEQIEQRRRAIEALKNQIIGIDAAIKAIDDDQ